MNKINISEQERHTAILKAYWEARQEGEKREAETLRHMGFEMGVDMDQTETTPPHYQSGAPCPKTPPQESVSPLLSLGPAGA